MTRTVTVPLGSGSELEETLAWQIRVAGLPIPEREVLFHPTRRWRFDFAYADRMLAIEVEGAVHANGRHTRGVGFEKDCEKYGEAAILGWRLIRVTEKMISSGAALDLISRALGEEA